MIRSMRFDIILSMYFEQIIELVNYFNFIALIIFNTYFKGMKAITSVQHTLKAVYISFQFIVQSLIRYETFNEYLLRNQFDAGLQIKDKCETVF